MRKINRERRRLLAGIPAATLFLTSQTPASAAVPDRQAANRRAIADMLDAWKNGHGNLLAILADDIRWTIAGNCLVSGTVTGKAGLVDTILKPFAARFARSKDMFKPTSIKGVYADGDMVVALWDGRGTANDGKPYANSYAWFLTMRDGLVVEATAFFDSIAFDDLWTRVKI